MTRRVIASGRGYDVPPPADYERDDQKMGQRLELSDLMRQAMRHGRPRFYMNKDGSFTCRIARELGRSRLETDFHQDATPEQAVLFAIGAAEEWGLPELEVKI